MPKHIVKVSGGKSGFRIVIPQKIVQEMGWEDADYVIVELNWPHGIRIRRLINDEIDKR